MSDIQLILDGVAHDLEWLDVEPVFVGGATIGLFLDDFGRSQLRPTNDVDCIVPLVMASWRGGRSKRNFDADGGRLILTGPCVDTSVREVRWLTS